MNYITYGDKIINFVCVLSLTNMATERRFDVEYHTSQLRSLYASGHYAQKRSSELRIHS